MPETSIFRSLLTVSGLTSECSEPHTFTLFVPTNDAWLKLPSESMTTLQQLAHRPVLIKLLLSHMSAGVLTSRSLAGLPKIHTAADSILPTPVIAPNLPTEGQAVITHPNIVATNGIIHLTNSLLVVLPEDLITPPHVEK